MKQSTKDNFAVLGGILFLLAIAGMIVLGVWLRFFAPCGAVDWMPTAEMPGRCLPGGRG